MEEISHGNEVSEVEMDETVKEKKGARGYE